MGRILSALRKLSSQNFVCLVLATVLASSVLCFAASSSAYVYVGSYVGVSQHISGYAVASDGSLQPLSGFPVNGPSGGLVAVGNFVFGVDGLNYVGSYTRSVDGSLSETSVVDENQYAPQDYGMATYALNPDRAGLTLNAVLSCGSCNSYVLPFAIGHDGQLSYVGGPLPSGGPAKWDGIFFFSPANDYAYTDCWGCFATLQRNADGSLTWLSNASPAQPSSPDPQDLVCYPGDLASSSTGYVALDWWGSQYWCGTNNTGYLMATYTVGSNGLLELVPNTGFRPQVLEYSTAFDPSGQYLAIAGCTAQYYCTGGSPAALEIYKLQANGTLAAVGGVQTATTTYEFSNVQWDGSGHVYALGLPTNCSPSLCVSDFYVYDFDGQNLTLAPGSPYRLNNVIGLAVAPQSQ